MQVVRESDTKTKVIFEVFEDTSDLSQVGDRSLLGAVGCGSHSPFDVFGPYLREVELVFPQSSPVELKTNGGPREYIISEFNVPCLLSDILLLQTRGIKVTVSTPERP